jgi:hypothetical protein
LASRVSNVACCASCSASTGSAAGHDLLELDGEFAAAGVDVGAAVDQRWFSRGRHRRSPGSAASPVGAGPFGEPHP